MMMMMILKPIKAGEFQKCNMTFFRMGTFIDSTHMKLKSPSK